MIPTVNRILFATDLSKNADNAFRYALSMAKAYDAKVHVVHVLEPMSHDAVVTLQLFMLDEGERNKAINDRHKAVKQLLTQNQQDFVNAIPEESRSDYDSVESVELVEGHLAEQILSRANNLKCDLIVMGTHEQGTDHTFVGTVVKRVLRRSVIPTLLVPSLK